MNQCLRCNKQCSVKTLFCDECELLLKLHSGHVAHANKDISRQATSPSTVVPQREDMLSDDIADRMTAPDPVVPSPFISQSAFNNIQANRVEQALHRLNEAARRIAAVEPGEARRPKNARLSPFYDPEFSDVPPSPMPDPIAPGFPGRPDDDPMGTIPDIWPWLQSDSEELAATGWSGRTDPLLSRRLPDSTETAHIEEEDIQRVAFEGPPSFSLPLLRQRSSSRLRVVLISLLLVVLLGLTIDGVMASFVLLHKRPIPAVRPGTPTLTLSSNNVTYGQNVTLHIRHFTPSTKVYITRDMDVAVHLDASNATVGPERSMIRVNPRGDADISMYIETSWDPGYHTIEAEDVQLHYTASTSLHIDNAGPTRPPHIVVDDLTIDLGSGIQGANSIRPLHMHNAGSSSIIWSASSDQPWLLLAPNQGTFSDNQTISVGGERANLKPGDYKGTIKVSSNAGPITSIQVIMTVRPLPPNAGPVLQVTPAVLAFVATDGVANPASQSLVVSNPGSKPMHWSLANNAPPAQSQGAFLSSLGMIVNWLSTDQTSGTLAPGTSTTVKVNIQSKSLLPGAYINTLVFSADQGTINTPQNVNISLTIQPQCSLQLSSNILSFTTVQGQSSPSAQSVSISATASCQATTNWSAVSSMPWLTVNSSTGQLKGAMSTSIGIGVNTTGILAGTYNGIVTVTTGRNTQAIQVQLIVQSPPPPGAPVLSVSPLNFNFNMTQGQPSPPGQVMSITNTGGSPLYWRSNILQSPVFGARVSPTGGTIAPGQTEQVILTLYISGASPGSFNFTGQIQGYDVNNKVAGGSPQSFTINGNVQQPCTLAPPSSSSLAFTAIQGASNPASQVLSFASTGNCAWPVNWNIAGSVPSWLSLSAISGAFNANGQSASLNVTANDSGLNPGTYTAQFSIAATDGTGQVLVGSAQSFSVSLTIQAPCVFQTPSALTFSTPQGQSPSTQMLGLSESGACVRPTSWTATSSSSWLQLSATSGTDNGGGSSVGVSINASGLAPGTYNGTITFSVSESAGAVQNGTQTVAVTLTVTGFTVSGTVNACADSACATPSTLAGATVTLTDSAGRSFTTTSDAAGNYSFGNVMLGTCTIAASGNNGASVGSVSLNVTGDQQGVIVNTMPS